MSLSVVRLILMKVWRECGVAETERDDVICDWQHFFVSSSQAATLLHLLLLLLHNLRDEFLLELVRNCTPESAGMAAY